MSSLLPFILNTVRTRAVDPTNTRFFLPVVLPGIQGNNSNGKLLPIQASQWSVGPITGPAGTTLTQAFESQWASYLGSQNVDLSNQYPIGNPANPAPVLNLGGVGTNDIVVAGLQNVFVEPGPRYTPGASGYEVALTLQVGYWDGESGRPAYPPLTLASPYTLQQALCLANNGAAVCNGNGSIQINGGGTADLSVTQAFIDAILLVSIRTGGSAGRSLEVAVKSLLFRGPDANTPPTLSVNQLTINAQVSQFMIGVWESLAKEALTSPDAVTGICSNLNAAINQASNLQSLSDEMTKQLGSAVDGVLGAVVGTLPASQPTTTVNPVDRYLFDRLRVALNEPGNALFLPQLLGQNQNPSLSPLKIPQINLPDINIENLQFQKCQLLNVDFAGLTNVKVSPGDLQLGENTIAFTGVLGGWNPPPKVSFPGGIPVPPAHGTAQFSLTPPGSPPLTGSLSLTVTATNLVGACTTAGADDADLVITLNSLKLTAANLVSSIQVVLDIDSFFKPLINQAVNQPNNLQQILDQLNGKLTDNLGGLSQQVTSYARTAINNGLK